MIGQLRTVAAILAGLACCLPACVGPLPPGGGGVQVARAAGADAAGATDVAGAGDPTGASVGDGTAKEAPAGTDGAAQADVDSSPVTLELPDAALPAETAGSTDVGQKVDALPPWEVLPTPDVAPPCAQPCNDQDPCTIDTCEPATGACAFTVTAGACDDGKPCTVGDSCKSGKCMGAVIAACDDKNPCTLDGCTMAGVCTHAPTPGACTDGNPCTNDTCSGGSCASLAVICNDNNPCTLDACAPAKGCMYTVIPGAPNCAKCALPTVFGTAGAGGGLQNVQKVSALKLAAKGVGCDLNGDGKPDNSLANLAGMVNGQLAQAVADGALVVLFEPTGYAHDGTAFQLRALSGTLDAASAGCNVAVAGAMCKFQASASNYDQTAAGGTCPAVSVFQGGQIQQGGALKAGGPTSKFTLGLVAQGLALPIVLNGATLTGMAATAVQWQTTQQGMMCGYMKPADLDAMVAGLPPDLQSQFGPLFKSLIKPDLDMDGNGAPESMSGALEFETVGAVITGVGP